MTPPPTIKIDRLTVRLAHQLGPRAKAIAPLIAQRLAQAEWTESHRADKVRIPAVSVQPAWSNASVAGSIARATTAHLNERKG